MRNFAFKLEKILDLRKYQEQEAKIELGRAIGVLSGLENQICALAEERSRTAAAQFSPSNSASMIRQYMIYLLRLDSTREGLLKDAALAEQKVEEAREAFMEASRTRQVLDKLKEKKEKEYKKALRAEEDKMTDDVVGNLRLRVSVTG